MISMIIAIFCIYNLKSTLPWWGFLVAVTLSFMSTLFFGALAGLIGFTVPITSLIQLIGGYLHPGKPVANMYFVLFGANAQAQALYLIHNLKLGQYGKLSPRCTFTVQIIGTMFGAVVNYALMSSITTNQREILLSIQGTNIWSGQVIQSFNSNVSSLSPSAKISADLFAGHRIRRPLKIHVQHWPYLSMDRFGASPRFRHPPSLLLRPPQISNSRDRL